MFGTVLHPIPDSRVRRVIQLFLSVALVSLSLAACGNAAGNVTPPPATIISAAESPTSTSAGEVATPSNSEAGTPAAYPPSEAPQAGGYPAPAVEATGTPTK
jgi:hypothetical protein